MVLYSIVGRKVASCVYEINDSPLFYVFNLLLLLMCMNEVWEIDIEFRHEFYSSVLKKNIMNRRCSKK